MEAIAFASAALLNKLDNVFLHSHGIRVTEPKFMKSSFNKKDQKENIEIVLNNTSNEIYYDAKKNKWVNSLAVAIANSIFSDTKEERKKIISSLKEPNEHLRPLYEEVMSAFFEIKANSEFEDNVRSKMFDFLIYSPEFTFLRKFETEGQIEPFGIRGEGVFKYLKTLIQEKNYDKLDEIKEYLEIFDWFDDIVTENEKTFSNDYTLTLKDRYIDDAFDDFNHKSTNEGFLFVLFYICLMVHEKTPDFFAIENIEASLNPKLCTELMKLLVKLARKYNKKLILTTHNPAILDGIDLKDDEQRLFRIHRNKSGHTKAFRIKDKSDLPQDKPIKLSEAFMRGYLGGLPTNF